MSIDDSSGKAQSSSSIAVPSAALTASGISSSDRATGVSGPSSCPDAIRNSSAYPIWPAAPVTVTRTGELAISGIHLLDDRVGELRGADGGGVVTCGLEV